MKTKLFINVLLLFGVISMVSCKKDSKTATATVDTFTSTLSGTSEVPATTSTATGMATFSYNETTYMLSGAVTYTGMTPTASHIHLGALGISGPVVISLTTTAAITSPITLAPMALDATQRAALLAGTFYVNIHSVAFPSGEIRGQLTKQASSSMTSTGTSTTGY